MDMLCTLLAGGSGVGAACNKPRKGRILIPANIFSRTLSFSIKRR